MYGLIIQILLILCVYYLYRTFSQPDITQGSDVILSAFKKGGIMGMIYRLEIYGNNSYKLFDHDKMIKFGILDDETSMNMGN